MDEQGKELNTDIGEDTMVIRNHEFEFVGVTHTAENDDARVEPTMDADNQHQQDDIHTVPLDLNGNWDNDGMDNIVQDAIPFAVNVQSELEWENTKKINSSNKMNTLPYNNYENLNNEDLDLISLLITKSELDYQNFEQLSVEPVNEEILVQWKTASELCTDLDSSQRGLLKFYFTIENFTAFCTRLNKATSDIFLCRDLSFRLFVIHNGALTVGAYLSREETESETMNSMEILASCDINVVDQATGSNLLTKSFTNHLFRAHTDWGFCDYMHFRSPDLVQNDSIKFCVSLRADPPICCSTKSKAITGYVGIRNQGATCYMNSLLQVLFFLNKFRTAVYRIPTEMDDNNSSMALALQKVFYNLQFSDTAVCTKNLTKSFGWSTVDVLMQHDVQEMMRLLIDKVESRMKHTTLEQILPSIFQGRFVSYVKCRDIEFSSQREEVFYDIQLSLENSTNLLDSFRQYVSPEMMDNDNKYLAGTHGLQVAEKGTLFISLPPVLFLHLLRFQFDGASNQVMKNNNFFEFYEHVDLTEFVREDDQTSWKYTLFAVLSHSGGGSHGHYVAYINPSLKGKWFKFDDDTISMVHQSDAIESNFGSQNDVDEWMKSMQLNAYMLVYVRDCTINEIFEETDPTFITDELKTAVMNDPEERNYSNLNRYNCTTDVYVFLSTLLESDFSLAFARDEQPSKMPKFSLARDVTAKSFKADLQSMFKLSSANQLRIWPIVHSSNHYSYPMYINEDDVFVPTVCEYRYKYSSFVSVWAEIALPGEELPPFDPAADVLVFYYFYCANKCRPFYMHHGYHNQNSNISQLVAVLNQLMDWPLNRELNIYQVLRGMKINELGGGMVGTFSDYVQHNDRNTMVMHVIFEAMDHDISTVLNSITLYYQDLLLRVTITICNVDQRKVEQTFDISLQSTFPKMVETLAKRLNYDEKRIQIFHSQSNGRGDAIPSSTTQTLKELFNCRSQKIQLFYKLHTIDVSNVETKRSFTFYWTPIDMKKQEKFTLYLSDGETIEQILAEAVTLVSPDPAHGSGKYRVLFINDNRLNIITDADEIYKYIDEVVGADVAHQRKSEYFRIEEIPKDDDTLLENEQYVEVFQSRSSQFRPATISIHTFIFKVNMNESWQCVKDRLKDRLRIRLNASETNWIDYRSAILSQDGVEVAEVDDTMQLI